MSVGLPMMKSIPSVEMMSWRPGSARPPTSTPAARSSATEPGNSEPFGTAILRRRSLMDALLLVGERDGGTAERVQADEEAARGEQRLGTREAVGLSADGRPVHGR